MEFQDHFEHDSRYKIIDFPFRTRIIFKFFLKTSLNKVVKNLAMLIVHLKFFKFI